MNDRPLPPAQGLPSERKPTPSSGAAGVPPAQPHSPAMDVPRSKEHHPVADQSLEVSHGPAVPGKLDGKPDDVVPAPPAIPERVSREDDKGPEFASVGLNKEPVVRKDDNTILFHWFPGSVSQVVMLAEHDMTISSIVGRVTAHGTDPGPTTLTFRKVPRGASLSTGKSLHTGSIDLLGIGNMNILGVEQIMAMTPDTQDLRLEDGDAIAADIQGPTANARGTATIKMHRK